jgi:hypothetical protein
MRGRAVPRSASITETKSVMSNVTTVLVAVALAGALSGCAGAPVVQNEYATGTYDPSVLNYISSKGGMPTEVIGDPFTGPREELDAVVTETMAKSHSGQHFPFFTKVPENFKSPYRVVVAFNPDSATGAYALCVGGVRTQARAPSAPDRVMAALCAGDRVITSAVGTIAGPTGPRDPGFVHLLAQLSSALFPPYSPNRGHSIDQFMVSQN